MGAPTLQVIKGGEALGMGLADYIWVDEDGDICFKKRVILIGKNGKGEPEPMVNERWTYNEGCDQEDCYDEECEHPETTRILSPSFYLPDPLRPQPSYIVLCEVRDDKDKCPDWNHRRVLRDGLEARGHLSKLVWFGFEQDYNMYKPYGEEGDAGTTFMVSERHLGACLDSGLLIHSSWNALLAKQPEFKVGYRAFPQDMDPDPPSALTVADHLIVARYLMEKIGSSKGHYPVWDPPNAFVSSPGLREPGADLQVQSHIIKEAIKDIGKTRIVPRADGRGYQCIEVTQSKWQDPYQLAVEMLDRFWPIIDPETPSEPEPVQGSDSGGADRLRQDDPEP